VAGTGTHCISIVCGVYYDVWGHVNMHTVCSLYLHGYGMQYVGLCLSSLGDTLQYMLGV